MLGVARRQLGSKCVLGQLAQALRPAAAAPARTYSAAAKEITVREALNTALDEEMSAGPSVFLMGEEVGECQGAYKISKGVLDKYGPDRVLDTSITESLWLDAAKHMFIEISPWSADSFRCFT